MPEPTAGQLHLNFVWIDWLVVIGYLVITTWIGHRLAGKQATIRDFFLGGKKLPWYAVAGSSIATEISAVTFIGVPAIVFAAGGDFTYMQLGIVGGLLSRLFVAFVLVPQYYKKLVYSPYDYMGNQLGGGVRGVMTTLFSFGGVLAQASRVYLTAVVLQLILAGPLDAVERTVGIPPLLTSIIIIGIVAVLWTIIGGIATVIWTDVILFAVFVIGGLTAIIVIATDVGGLGNIFSIAGDAHKFKTFTLDLKFDPTERYTIWAAIIGTTFGNVGAYGTDQLMAQRIFCCANKREAMKAVLASYFGQIVTALMLLVGAGLFVYYKGLPGISETPANPLPIEQWARPLSGDAAAKYLENKDNIFPIFILSDAIPPGVTGLMIAGIFAAAISSFDSILAALSQTSLNALYLPLRRRMLGITAAQEELLHNSDDESSRREHRHIIFVSRLLVVGWALMLCLVAVWINHYKTRYDLPILDLALQLASWVQGSLLAAFLLAWLPLKINGRGLVWAAPLAVLCVSALRFHDQSAQVFYGVCGGILVATWIIFAFVGPDSRRNIRLAKTPVLIAGAAILVLISRYGQFETETGPKPLAWTWWSLVGGIIAFTFGYLLADPKEREEGISQAVAA